MATSLSCSAGFILGMDLGTTSVKVVLLDAQSKTVTDCRSFPTNSDICYTPDIHGKEQDTVLIIAALHRCMDALPKDKLQKVKRIGVCGQMHGILLWKSKTGWEWLRKDAVIRYIPKDVSQLITWQDGRCSTDFLSALPKPDSHLSVATGFGCATIFWYMKHRPEFLSGFNVAGTIQDYVVSMLCSLDHCVMTEQNAASWGYFNTTTHQWNKQILKNAGFPVHLLPVVVEGGAVAGHTSSEWYGIPANTPVGAALGDFQCSVYSCMTDTGDADCPPGGDVNAMSAFRNGRHCAQISVTSLKDIGDMLNMSTSAQLTFAMPAEFFPLSSPDPLSPVAYFPYFCGSYLAVAASLNGGNVMATFVKMLESWIKEFGLEVSESRIYSQLVQSALTQPNTDLIVIPALLGERHDPTTLASVCQISPTNLSLGHMTRAVCRGIIRNMATMMPPQSLQAAGVKRIIGSGNALSCNTVLQQEVERVFPFPVVYGKDVDSAVGVAMVFNDQI